MKSSLPQHEQWDVKSTIPLPDDEIHSEDHHYIVSWFDIESIISIKDSDEKIKAFTRLMDKMQESSGYFASSAYEEICADPTLKKIVDAFKYGDWRMDDDNSTYDNAMRVVTEE